MGTEPVWPPPSPPCTSTASTPHSRTFSAWRLAPIDGTTSTPPSCSWPISASLGAWAKLATFTCSSISSSMRSPMSAASARRFTPNGLVVRRLTSAIAVRSCADVHGGAGEDAEPAGLGGGRGEPGTRHPAHAGLHDRVLDPDQVAEAGVQAGVHQPGTSWLRMPVGSRHAMTASSSAVGARVSATSPSITSSKPVAATTSSTVTPGCTLTRRMR